MGKTTVFKIPFARPYPYYIKKVETKGRTKEELYVIICWLTGYNQQEFHQQLDKKADFQTFFDQAPRINPNVSKITGVICGNRVEEIEDKLMQMIRYLDKLIDELAKGKTLDKILRKSLESFIRIIFYPHKTKFLESAFVLTISLICNFLTRI